MRPPRRQAQHQFLMESTHGLWTHADLGLLLTSSGADFLHKILVEAMAPFNGSVYTWLLSDGIKLEVGFLIDRLSAQGPVTMRLLRTVRREIDVYDRNRERLFEIPDPALRARIHMVLLRATMGVEGAIEAAAEAMGPIDLAVLSIGTGHVLAALEDCAAADVAGVIVLANAGGGALSARTTIPSSEQPSTSSMPCSSRPWNSSER